VEGPLPEIMDDLDSVWNKKATELVIDREDFMAKLREKEEQRKEKEEEKTEDDTGSLSDIRGGPWDENLPEVKEQMGKEKKRRERRGRFI
jgi:hypothetical protein